VEGEVCEFKALDCLVVAEVEEGCIFVKFPFFSWSDEGVLVLNVACNFSSRAVFFCLFYGALGPSTCGEIVSTGLLTIAKQVLADSAELLGRSSLEEKDRVILWDLEKFPKVGLRCLGNFLERLAAMAHFHH